MEGISAWQAFAATGEIRHYLEYKRAAVQKEGQAYADRDPRAGASGGKGGGG